LGLLTIAGPPALAQLPTVTPRSGLIITRSVRIRPGTWRLPVPADSALITVSGDDITLDFTGATLEGLAPDADPDGAAGIAVRIEGGRNVRIVGPRIRGYRIAILARGTRNLDITGGDLSYNWKPRLFSLVEHESLADWLSFHRNDRGEWLRFGAAIYLEDVSGARIQRTTARQGMNGLLMTRCDRVTVRENDFSYNSGIGIGLYRSSDNTIVYNVVEFNVCGYSHGRYRRGQDSAGILLYEQSSRNVVARNSVTHGGDGLFLWAGQSTMDSGTGGANDNIVFDNDFSWAPTNGIEATFSRNTFLMNHVQGSEYGLWGGYSFGSLVAGNSFVRNRFGIAIEHGQENRIAFNLFTGDSTAIRLWANPIEPSDWGYPRFRDTRSRDYRIEDNEFSGNRVAIRASNTAGIRLTGNRWIGVDTALVLADTAAFAASGNRAIDPAAEHGVIVVPEELLAPVRRILDDPARRPETPMAALDRSAIIVDEWGPYDWRSPRLWPVDSTRAVPLRLAVLGPPGRWRAVSRRGLASLSSASGRVGDTIVVTPAPDSAGDWELLLEYRGAATTSPRGAVLAAGRPYRFSYGRFEPAADWDIRFVAWGDSSDPRARPDAFAALFAAAPLLARHAPRLDYMWYRPTIQGLPQERWALEATTTVTLARGDYTLRTISDDGVRVWVDDALVVDNWSLHESAVDAAPLMGGRHELRVRYFQVGGWSELRLDIVRGSTRSRGSPGPH